jgi:sec-independent protein translocase protein TatA
MWSVIAMFAPGPMEMLIVGMVALLLFGNRLPSVMRSMGRGITEFKKGINGIEDEVDAAARPKKEEISS